MQSNRSALDRPGEDGRRGKKKIVQICSNWCIGGVFGVLNFVELKFKTRCMRGHEG